MTWDEELRTHEDAGAPPPDPSKVDLPPLPIIAVMPGSILSAEARFPLVASICSPPYNTVIINNHQSSGRTAFALLKP